MIEREDGIKNLYNDLQSFYDLMEFHNFRSLKLNFEKINKRQKKCELKKIVKIATR